jgi:hypothetical protein
MKVFNNTSNSVSYDISAPGVGDCGTLAADGTADWPSYDNTDDVKVGFSAPLELTINDSSTGKVVTIGLYVE